MAFEIKQTWWHITDVSYFNYPSKRLRQVMDIYTNQNILPLRIASDFLGLRVYARNSFYNELAFTWNQGGSQIFISLDLNSFPNVPNELNPDSIPNYKHTKIEIEYIISDKNLIPSERDGGLSKMIDRHLSPKFLSILRKEGELQPEIYITPPKGWEINSDGHSITTVFLWVENGVAQKLEDPEYMLFINSENGEKSYNYLFDSNGYNGPNASGHNFEMNYLSSISNTSLLLSIVFPIGFLTISFVLGIFVFLSSRGIFQLNLGYTEYFGYLAIVVTYIYVYLSYVKEGYLFPKPIFAQTGVGYTILIIAIGIICKLNIIGSILK